MNQFKVQSSKFKDKTVGLAVLVCTFVVGCQQKMAEQPAPRPYDAFKQGVFANDQSAQPLPHGAIFRGQRPSDDPLLTWLTPAGQAPKVNPDWKKAVDPSGDLQATAGAPTDEGNFVKEFPFEMTETDLNRGQQRYNVFCGVCHGAAGNGWGKIVERGFLRPPSYHQDAMDKAFDWSSTGQPSTELKQGYSRGFFRYGIKVPLDQVPVGYIYQVITWGYGGMPDHASQIPVEDRWRIVAYVRALQLSQRLELGKLQDLVTGNDSEKKAKIDGIKQRLDEAGKPKADAKHDDKKDH